MEWSGSFPGAVLSAAEPVRGASLQHLRFRQLVDDEVRERRAARSGRADSEQAQDGSLDRDRRVAVDERLHAAGGVLRQLAGTSDLCRLDEELGQAILLLARSAGSISGTRPLQGDAHIRAVAESQGTGV